MSQTVKIDEAAQAAIAEIVGMPWTKDYYDNTLDEDRDFLALVERSGASVRVLVKEGGYIADMWHFEAEQIANSILRAAKDAKAFQKAQTEWVGVQMQRLNCEIKGTQNMWGYGFYVNGRHYEVHFTTNEKFRTCVILNQAAKLIFRKVTDDLSKVSQDDAALVLKRSPKKCTDAVRSSRWKPSRYAPRRVGMTGKVELLRPWRRLTKPSVDCPTASER